MSEPALRLDRGRAQVIADNVEREQRFTDVANAVRFAAANLDVAYVRPRREWLVFDGRRWIRDERNQVAERAKVSMASLVLEALRSEPVDAPLAKHAVASMQEPKLRRMLSLAESEHTIAAVPADFDADPWALTCLNGTLDLKTGEIRKTRREDRGTKLAPVAYDPSARFELWDRFLGRVVPDPDVRDFLQRAVGYSLTGDVREEVLYFIHGPGASGKSTFIEAVKAALGDYAVTADFETFVRRPPTGGPRNDVAALAGARLVVSIEVDEGRALAEGLVKLITGGDTITARRLYQEAVEFRPQLKLWLIANATPRVRDDDSALWRRILRIPFDSVIPEGERDPNVKTTLRDPDEAGPAILAWAVQGCLAWQREGLKVPPLIRDATAAYQASQDPLSDFLDERCELNATAWVSAAAVREAYEAFAGTNGDRPLKGRAFAARLAARGLIRGRRDGNRVRTWEGLRLRAGT